jgi:hypothetical protein
LIGSLGKYVTFWQSADKWWLADWLNYFSLSLVTLVAETEQAEAHCRNDVRSRRLTCPSCCCCCCCCNLGGAFCSSINRQMGEKGFGRTCISFHTGSQLAYLQQLLQVKLLRNKVYIVSTFALNTGSIQRISANDFVSNSPLLSQIAIFLANYQIARFWFNTFRNIMVAPYALQKCHNSPEASLLYRFAVRVRGW